MVILKPQFVGCIPAPKCLTSDITQYGQTGSLYEELKSNHKTSNTIQRKHLEVVATINVKVPRVMYNPNDFPSIQKAISDNKDFLYSDKGFFPSLLVKEYDPTMFSRYGNPLGYKNSIYQPSWESRLVPPSTNGVYLQVPVNQDFSFVNAYFDATAHDFDYMDQSSVYPVNLTDEEAKHLFTVSPQSTVIAPGSQCMQLVSSVIEALIQIMSGNGYQLATHRIDLSASVPYNILGLQAALPSCLSLIQVSSIQNLCIVQYKDLRGNFHANIANASKGSLRFYDNKEFLEANHTIVAIYQVNYRLDMSKLPKDHKIQKEYCLLPRIVTERKTSGAFIKDEKVYPIIISQSIYVHGINKTGTTTIHQYFSQQCRSQGIFYMPYHRETHNKCSLAVGEFNTRHVIGPFSTKACAAGSLLNRRAHGYNCLLNFYHQICEHCQAHWSVQARSDRKITQENEEAYQAAANFTQFCGACTRKLHKNIRDCTCPKKGISLRSDIKSSLPDKSRRIASAHHHNHRLLCKAKYISWSPSVTFPTSLIWSALPEEWNFGKKPAPKRPPPPANGFPKINSKVSKGQNITKANEKSAEGQHHQSSQLYKEVKGGRGDYDHIDDTWDRYHLSDIEYASKSTTPGLYIPLEVVEKYGKEFILKFDAQSLKDFLNEEAAKNYRQNTVTGGASTQSQNQSKAPVTTQKVAEAITEHQSMATERVIVKKETIAEEITATDQLQSFAKVEAITRQDTSKYTISKDIAIPRPVAKSVNPAVLPLFDVDSSSRTIVFTGYAVPETTIKRYEELAQQPNLQHQDTNSSQEYDSDSSETTDSSSGFSGDEDTDFDNFTLARYGSKHATYYNKNGDRIKIKNSELEYGIEWLECGPGEHLYRQYHRNFRKFNKTESAIQMLADELDIKIHQKSRVESTKLTTADEEVNNQYYTIVQKIDNETAQIDQQVEVGILNQLSQTKEKLGGGLFEEIYSQANLEEVFPYKKEVVNDTIYYKSNIDLVFENASQLYADVLQEYECFTTGLEEMNVKNFFPTNNLKKILKELISLKGFAFNVSCFAVTKDKALLHSEASNYLIRGQKNNKILQSYKIEQVARFVKGEEYHILQALFLPPNAQGLEFDDPETTKEISLELLDTIYPMDGSDSEFEYEDEFSSTGSEQPLEKLPQHGDQHHQDQTCGRFPQQGNQHHQIVEQTHETQYPTLETQEPPVCSAQQTDNSECQTKDQEKQEQQEDQKQQQSGHDDEHLKYLVLGNKQTLKIDFSKVTTCQQVFGILRAHPQLVEVEPKLKVQPPLFYAIVVEESHFAVYSSESCRDLVNSGELKSFVLCSEIDTLFIRKPECPINLDPSNFNEIQSKRYQSFIEQYHFEKYNNVVVALQNFILNGQIDPEFCNTEPTDRIRCYYEATHDTTIEKPIKNITPFHVEIVQSNDEDGFLWFRAYTDTIPKEAVLVARHQCNPEDFIVSEDKLIHVHDRIKDTHRTRHNFIYTRTGSNLYRWELGPYITPESNLTSVSRQLQVLSQVSISNDLARDGFVCQRDSVLHQGLLAVYSVLSKFTFHSRYTDTKLALNSNEAEDTKRFCEGLFNKLPQTPCSFAHPRSRNQVDFLSDLHQQASDVDYGIRTGPGIRTPEFKAPLNFGPVLGSGVQGMVYDKLTHVVKVQPKETGIYEEKIIRQIHSLGVLQSTVRLQGSWIEDSNHYMKLDKIEGADLLTAISKHSFDQRLGLAYSIYKELKYYSKAGVAHNDLHPCNIIVDSTKATIVDFGLAVTTQQCGPATIESSNAQSLYRILLSVLFNVDTYDVAANIFFNTVIYDSVDAVTQCATFSGIGDIKHFPERFYEESMSHLSIPQAIPPNTSGKKIAIVGAPGVGKTTLKESLDSTYGHNCSVYIIQEFPVCEVTADAILLLHTSRITECDERQYKALKDQDTPIFIIRGQMDQVVESAKRVHKPTNSLESKIRQYFKDAYQQKVYCICCYNNEFDFSVLCQDLNNTLSLQFEGVVYQDQLTPSKYEDKNPFSALAVEPLPEYNPANSTNVSMEKEQATTPSNSLPDGPSNVPPKERMTESLQAPSCEAILTVERPQARVDELTPSSEHIQAHNNSIKSSKIETTSVDISQTYGNNPFVSEMTPSANNNPFKSKGQDTTPTTPGYKVPSNTPANPNPFNIDQSIFGSNNPFTREEFSNDLEEMAKIFASVEQAVNAEFSNMRATFGQHQCKKSKNSLQALSQVPPDGVVPQTSGTSPLESGSSSKRVSGGLVPQTSGTSPLESGLSSKRIPGGSPSQTPSIPPPISRSSSKRALSVDEAVPDSWEDISTETWAPKKKTYTNTKKAKRLRKEPISPVSTDTNTSMDQNVAVDYIINGLPYIEFLCSEATYGIKVFNAAIKAKTDEGVSRIKNFICLRRIAKINGAYFVNLLNSLCNPVDTKTAMRQILVAISTGDYPHLRKYYKQMKAYCAEDQTSPSSKTLPLTSSTFVQIKFQDTFRKPSAYRNSCYLHACVPVWEKMKKYLTLASEDMLKEFQDQQGCASELLCATGVPFFTIKCSVHGGFYTSATELCNQCEISDKYNYVQVQGSYSEKFQVRNIEVKPFVWLYYSGNGMSGHWFSIFERDGIKYHCDTGRVVQFTNPLPQATYTVCELVFKPETATANLADLSGLINIYPEHLAAVVCQLESTLAKGYSKKETKDSIDYKCARATYRVHKNLHKCHLHRHDTIYVTAGHISPSKFHHTNKVYTKEVYEDIHFTAKPVKSKAPKWRKTLRVAITEAFKKLSCVSVVLDAGCGEGKDLIHLKSITNEVLGVDLHEDNAQFSLTGKRHRMRVAYQQVDMNTETFASLMDKVPLTTSFFSWHFHTAPERHLDQYHILPIYNKNTYHTWDEVATVNTLQADDDSVYHKITMNTLTSTERLYTKEYWQNKFGCDKVEIQSINDIIPEEQKLAHFENYIIIKHFGECCVNTNKPPAILEVDLSDPQESFGSATTSIETSRESTSGTIPSSECSVYSGYVVEEVVKQLDVLTVHSSDIDHQGVHCGISCILGSKGSDICLYPDCVHCTYSTDTFPSEQVLQNIVKFNKCTNVTKNQLSNYFFNTLHTLEELIIPLSDESQYDLEKFWVQAYVDKSIYDCLLLLPSANSSPSGCMLNINIAKKHFDSCVNKIDEIPMNANRVVVWAGTQSETTEACNHLRQFFRYNMATVDFQYGFLDCYEFCEGSFRTKEDKRSWLEWLTESITGTTSLEGFTCIYGSTTETSNVNESQPDFINRFIQKHHLNSTARFTSGRETYFFSGRCNGKLPKNIEGCYHQMSKCERDGELTVSSATIQGRTTAICSIVYSSEGHAVYLNGIKQDFIIRRNVGIQHLLRQELEDSTLQVSDFIVTHFKKTKTLYRPDLLWFLPFFLFPGINTLLLLAFCYLMTRRPVLSKIACYKSFSVVANHLPYKIAEATGISLQNARISTLIASALTVLYILSYLFFAVVANHDLVNSNRPSYHSIFQQILALAGIIPPLDDYKQALTMRKLCGRNYLCHFGKPYNKAYLDDYRHYVNSTGASYFTQYILALICFLPPWAWPLLLTFAKPSVQLAIFNIIISIGIGFYMTRFYWRCCNRTGPFCPRHMKTRQPQASFVVDGRVYVIPVIQTNFCKIHNYWCNNNNTHLLPKPIARTIEDSFNIKKNSIKCDSFYKFVANGKAAEDLPLDFKDYSPDKVYKIDSLDFSVWYHRCALFAYRTCRQVSLAASGDYNTRQVSMTGDMLKLFDEFGGNCSDYIQGQVAGPENNFHFKFYNALTNDQRAAVEEYCYKSGQKFTLTCIDLDNYLSGKVPSCFDLYDLPSCEFHQETIQLDKIPTRFHNQISTLACEFSFTVKKSKIKHAVRSISGYLHIIGIILLGVVLLCNVIRVKVNKGSYPAGLNPSGYDYTKGQLYIHQQITGAEPVSLSSISKYQAWLFQNGTFAFTQGRVGSTQRTDCGEVSQSFYVREHVLECGKRVPISVSLSLFSIYIMQYADSYVTPYGSIDTDGPTTCIGFGSDLMCHAHVVFMPASYFIFYSTLFLVLIVTVMYIFLKLHAYFGRYTPDILGLSIIHLFICICYCIHPLCAFFSVGGLVFIPLPVGRNFVYTYCVCVGAFLSGIQVFIVMLFYLCCVLVYWYLSRNPSDGISYKDGVVEFGSDYSKIANSTFVVQVDSINRIINTTGMPFEKILEYSRGPLAKPESALAQKLIHCQITGTSSLYEPPVRKVPVFLQSACHRVNEIFVDRGNLNNVCLFQYTDGNTTQTIGHGVFLDSNTVLTARHVYGLMTNNDNVSLYFNKKKISILSFVEVGMNTRITTSPTEAKALVVDEHHDLRLGHPYTQLSLLDCKNSDCRLYPLVPTSSGHFVNAKTFAGESGTPIFYGSTLIGIHQGTVNHSVHTHTSSSHALATRCDGTGFDKDFNDIMKTTGDLKYDGNTLFRTHVVNHSPPLTTRQEFLAGIAAVNKVLDVHPYITSIDDPAILGGESYSTEKFLAFVTSRMPIRQCDFQAVAVTEGVELQSNRLASFALSFTCPTCITLCLAIFNIISMIYSGTVDNFKLFQLMVSGLLATTLIRNRSAMCTVILAPWVLNLAYNYYYLAIKNLDVLFNVEDPVLYLAAAKFYFQDFVVLLVVLFFFVLRVAIMPYRQLLFTFGFGIGVFISGGLSFEALILYFVCASFPSSWFAFFCILFANSRYVVVWYIVNLFLSLRLQYPKVIQMLYRHFTADVVIISRTYISSFTAVHGRLPSFLECVFSILYYSNAGGTVEFLPQSRFIQRKVVGQHINSTNIAEQSKALMDPDKKLFPFFVQAVEAILQSTNAAQNAFLQWVQTNGSIRELEEWQSANPLTADASREDRKHYNIVNSRIQFLRAKENQLAKQLNLIHQEQIRGLIRTEQAHQLSQMVDKAVVDMQERFAFKHRKFARGVIAASTLYHPELVVVTNKKSSDAICYDDEAECLAIMGDDDVYHLKSLETNAGKMLTCISDVEDLPENAFPLSGVLLKPSAQLQANIGYSLNTADVELDIQEGVVKRILHKEKDKFVLANDNNPENVMLPVNNTMVEFKPVGVITPSLLTAIIAKLREHTVNLQSHIRFGGIPNVKEHVAVSSEPLRTHGYYTVWGPSVCWKCLNNVKHICDYPKFVQIPSGVTDAKQFLIDNKPCQHNKFVCTCNNKISCNEPVLQRRTLRQRLALIEHSKN